MINIALRPISAELFAPYGIILQTGEVPQLDVSQYLENQRPNAAPRICLISVPPTRLPLSAEKMERHQYSSQAFVPMNCHEYVVFVAPSGVDGRPDLSRANAFRVPGDIGINYRANVWHYPMTVLEDVGELVMIMFTDNSTLDEEFVTLDVPITISEPDIIPETTP